MCRNVIETLHRLTKLWFKERMSSLNFVNYDLPGDNMIPARTPLTQWLKRKRKERNKINSEETNKQETFQLGRAPINLATLNLNSEGNVERVTVAIANSSDFNGRLAIRPKKCMCRSYVPYGTVKAEKLTLKSVWIDREISYLFF